MVAPIDKVRICRTIDSHLTNSESIKLAKRNHMTKRKKLRTFDFSRCIIGVNAIIQALPFP